MSAAPGCEFPNPCPVCGADDDHRAWMSGFMRRGGFGDACPHPAERGHGTGCMCAGVSRETRQREMQEALSRSTLEQRVAALEDQFALPTMPSPLSWAMTDEQAARFKEEFEAAAADWKHKPPRLIPSPPGLLDPETVRHLLRESVTAIKPGEVLFFTCPEHCTPMHVREIQDYINMWLADHAPDIRVLVLPHGEMAAAESRAE